jgi:general secretion pathway protein D
VSEVPEERLRPTSGRRIMRSWLALTVVLGVLVLCHPASARAVSGEALAFENADLSAVVKHIGGLTGLTFLFDPDQVKGKITVLSPKSVSPAEALELLTSALALRGYRLVSSAGGMWIVPAERFAPEAVTVKLVTLNHALAGEVAYTLGWIAPPGVRIVPYYPTNSIIISGPPAAVEKLIDVIK